MMLHTASRAVSVKASTPTSRALVRPVPASRRVCAQAAVPGKPVEGNQTQKNHGLISVWEEKALAEIEQSQAAKPASSDKHSLISVWEEHEMKAGTEQQHTGSLKEDSILNHPTGEKPQVSSYDSEW